MSKAPQFQSTLPVSNSGRPGHDLAAYDRYANQQLPDDDIDLLSLWRAIVKHKWTILFITSLFIATTLVATLLMRPVFRSEVLLEIKPPSGSVVTFQNVEQVDYQPLEYKTTQQNILKSNSVADAVIAELDLGNNPELTGEITQRGFVNGLEVVLGSIRNLISPEPQPELVGEERKHYEILQRFRERLTIAPIRNSDLFSVSFESFDPALASQVANSVVDQYISLSGDLRIGSTSSAKQYLESEIKAVQDRLEQSERQLTNYARDNEIIDVEEKDDIITTQLNDLNSQLTVAHGQRIAAEALYRQSLSEDGFEVLPQVLGNDLIQQLKSEYASLESEYFRLSKVYKPAYPKLQQIQVEMDQIKSSLDREVVQIANSLKSDYQQLLKKEELLELKVEESKTGLLALKDRSIEYNILKREWETNKQLYRGLLERMKEVGVAAGTEISNISVIDKAQIPIEPFKPRMIFNLAIGTVLGLIFSLGVAFLLVYLDNTVRTPEELENITGISSLGLVAQYKADKLSEKSKEAMQAGKHLGLISHIDRHHEISESFRSIRASLMFSTPSGLPKVIQITSTVSGEGKSTIATNLAAVLADNGDRVLLIDADLRRPTLNRIFSIQGVPGLSEILTEQTGKLPVYATPIDNLFLIPSGTLPPNPSELLGSGAFDTLLETLGQHYDYILVDSAPLLGLADSVIVSTRVDGLVYVVHAGEINGVALREGIKRLRQVNAPILGAILNRIDFSSDGYRYTYGADYYRYRSAADTGSVSRQQTG